MVMVRYALRNLWRAPLRTLFTAISLITILTLYVVLQSVTDGFSAQIDRLFAAQGFDLIVQSRYAATPVSSSIDEATLRQLRLDPQVSEVDAVLVGRKRYENRASLFIFGMQRFDLLRARLGVQLIEGDASHLLIGERSAEALHLSCGDEIAFGTLRLRVSGIFSSWLPFLNAALMMPFEDAQKLLAKPNEASLAMIRLHRRGDAAMMIERIGHLYPDLVAVDATALPDQFGPLKSLYRFAAIVALLSLVMSFAVMFNTFLLSGLERTKEVGVLCAIGWSRGRIVGLVIVEALILCMVCAVAAYVLAWPLLWALQLYFSEVYMYLPQAPSPMLLYQTLGMAALIAGASALVPALYATRLSVAEALRHGR